MSSNIDKEKDASPVAIGEDVAADVSNLVAAAATNKGSNTTDSHSAEPPVPPLPSETATMTTTTTTTTSTFTASASVASLSSSSSSTKTGSMATTCNESSTAASSLTGNTPPSPTMSQFEAPSLSTCSSNAQAVLQLPAAVDTAQAEGTTPTTTNNPSVVSEIAALQQALQRLEVKHEYNLATLNKQWRTKFQTMEATLKDQGRKVQATQRLLQESHTPLLNQLTKLVQKQQVAIQQQHVHQQEQRQQQIVQNQLQNNSSNSNSGLLVTASTATTLATATTASDDQSTTSSSVSRDPEGHVIVHKRPTDPPPVSSPRGSGSGSQHRNQSRDKNNSSNSRQASASSSSTSNMPRLLSSHASRIINRSNSTPILDSMAKTTMTAATTTSSNLSPRRLSSSSASSNSDSPSVTLATERWLQLEMRSEVEHCLAQRETVIETMQQQVEAQARQLTTIQDSVQAALVQYESLRYDQGQTKQSVATNAQVQLAQVQKIDGEIQTMAEALKTLLRDRKTALEKEEATKVATAAAAAKESAPTPRSEPATVVMANPRRLPLEVVVLVDSENTLASPINLCHVPELSPVDSLTFSTTPRGTAISDATDVVDLKTLKSECFNFIHQENERMMQVWGTQFDDLAVYMQDNLDAQRTSITEARTSTFDQVDTEAKARATTLQAQYTELAKRVIEQGAQIQEVKEDQEKSLIIVVESLVNLKTKVEEMAEQQTTQENLQLSSDVDMQKLLRIIETKTNDWKSSFGKLETDLTKVKEEVRLLSAETDTMAEDREAIQEILDESLALFASKSDTASELWNAQFQKLERQMKLLDYERLLNEISKVMAAWKRKFADVMRLYSHQAKELSTLQDRVNERAAAPPALGDDERDAFHDYLEMRRKKVTFSDIKVDQKKYKKVLWQSKQNRAAAAAAAGGQDSAEDTRTENIQYYDLTFALSTEQ